MGPRGVKIGRASCRGRRAETEEGGGQDGIRDTSVTGVQTCALPICWRIADGNVEALPELAHLADDLDHALSNAVAGLRSLGYSWAEIAARFGTTRQAAQQRWGHAA